MFSFSILKAQISATSTEEKSRLVQELLKYVSGNPSSSATISEQSVTEILMSQINLIEEQLKVHKLMISTMVGCKIQTEGTKVMKETETMPLVAAPVPEEVVSVPEETVFVPEEVGSVPEDPVSVPEESVSVTAPAVSNPPELVSKPISLPAGIVAVPTESVSSSSTEVFQPGR